MDWLEPEERRGAEVSETSTVVVSGSLGRWAALAAVAAAVITIGALVWPADDPEKSEQPPPTTLRSPTTTVAATTTTTSTTMPPAANSRRAPFPEESDFAVVPPLGLTVFFQPSASDTEIESLVSTAKAIAVVDRVAVETSSDALGTSTSASMALVPGSTATDVYELRIRFEDRPGVDGVSMLMADPQLRVLIEPLASPDEIANVNSFIARQTAALTQRSLDQTDTFAEFEQMFRDDDELASSVDIDDLPSVIVITIDRYSPRSATRELIANLEQLPGVRQVA